MADPYQTLGVTPNASQDDIRKALVYIAAAIAEIAGCFAFWGWLRLGKPVSWRLPGVLFLVGFAYLLTLVETNAAGRAYAATAASTNGSWT